MSKAVILSHPFSGALLAFFDAQLQGGRHATAASYHPYYRTLYGDDFQKWTDISLTLLLLFEHVVIAPADNPMPDHAKYAAGGVYNNPELGLVPSWDDFLKAREGLDESVTQDLQDPV